MSSINKVIIVGRLGQDPEIRYTQSGDAALNISVATSESWKDKSTGEKREATEWHRISIFGKPAEIAAQYLRKGSLIYVEGKNKTKKYVDKSGVEKVSFEIQCDSFKMLGAAPDGQQNAKPAANAAKIDSIGDDEIPF